MQFIDTHAHLYAEEFSKDVDEVIERAEDKGISKIVMPAIDKQSHQDLINLAKRYKSVLYPLMGVHPTSVKKDYRKELDIAEELLFNNESLFYGIGEVGIDLYWDKSFYNEQVEVFAIQIKWAQELNLPVIIHTRDSFNETLKVLKKQVDSQISGIFHCFGGSLEQAKEVIDMGFSIGVGGVLTFKNSKLHEVIKHIDIKNIVLETDSPYLAPVPYRGKRNDSSYIRLIAEKVGAVYGISIQEVAKYTTENANKIFKF